MRTLPFYQVDVFTDRPFIGNPLAVFPAAGGLTVAQMQAIAGAADHIEDVLVGGPVQPVLRGGADPRGLIDSGA